MTVCTKAYPSLGLCHVFFGLPGSPPGSGPLLSSDVAPPATVGDVPELLDVDVQHVAGVLVLVPAHGLPGGPVHMGEPVEPASDQDSVSGRGRDPDLRSELDRTQTLAQPQRHDALGHHR